MSDETEKTDKVEIPAIEVARFYGDVGREIVALDRMLRSPTETRPYVYELRLDLWPVSNKAAMGVFKGFGEDGSLIAFHDGASLLGVLRGAHDRLVSGNLRFGIDQYPPRNYDKRVAAFLKDVEYRGA